MTIGLLISGDLGSLVLKHYSKLYKLTFVMTDRTSEKIIEACKKNIINLASGLCFNVHGSLLPKYRGRTPHFWAVINNEKETGITAHIIDEGCDTGPILEQIKVPIDLNDNWWNILEKYKKLYIPLIERVIEKYSLNQLKMIAQDERKATFFPKRTPDDGLINWNWESTKIIIDSVSKVGFKHSRNIKNGTIVCIKPLIVKCSDSAKKINKIRSTNKTFNLTEILN